MGIAEHMKPRPGIWPVHPDRLARRTAWVDRYERERTAFAACQFVDHLGVQAIDPKVQGVCELHDELAQALRQLDLA